MHVEDGYGDNPYHCRVHAADVLRSLHVLLHRGGVMKAISKHTTGAATVPDGDEVRVARVAGYLSVAESGQADCHAKRRSWQCCSHVRTCFISPL